ncbi:uncharacterized protein LOC122719448 isoform X2 [Apis laboriosa]|uniref:uncharacterized protein LOC122719448 isoform X2 n=1 Tax=Apis laboriosa TaxID=183418 RepID=UPI001CC5C8D2|nr:uncharacterized protein LOC122719448 isoform X2 [Apis laboriosa]
MNILDYLRHLLKDFSYLLKIHKLIIAGVCIYELLKHKEYMIPRWLWVIYCIDSCTYSIVYISIGFTQMFEKSRKLPELIYFTIGVVFHLIGGISGIMRASYIEDIDEVDPTRSEFKIGILLLANFVVLFCEAAYLGYAEFSKKKESTASN